MQEGIHQPRQTYLHANTVSVCSAIAIIVCIMYVGARYLPKLRVAVT